MLVKDLIFITFGTSTSSLFYFLTTSVQVSGGSSFLDDNVFLLPVKLPSSHTLHYLNPSYRAPTYRTYNLSLIALKFYSGLLGAYHEALSSCTFWDSKCRNFTVNTTSKNNLDYIDIQVVKKDQSNLNGPHHLLSPNINIMGNNISTQFIHHQFGHAYHQRIQQMIKLGIYTGIPNYIPKLYHLFRAYLISMRPCLTRHPNFST